MSEILLYYKRPDPTTWVYLSSFLTLGLFFVFHRFWSVRNLDILLLILLAPGLLMVHEGRRRQLQEIESEVLTQREESQYYRRGFDETAAASPTLSPTLSPTTSGPDRVTQWSAASRLVSVNQAPPDQAPSDQASATMFGSESERADSAVTAASDFDAGSTENALADSGPQADGGLPFDSGPLGDSATAVDEFGPESADESDAASQGQVDTFDLRRAGFISLFFVQFLILIRLLLDPLMIRRPQLDPNLTNGGLVFIGISLFVFMMANIIASTPRIQIEQGPKLGPGYALMNMLPAIPTRPVTDALAASSPAEEAELTPSQQRLATLAKVLAICAHAAILVGIVLIGNWHFNNMRAGVGCATLYLMLPYTAQMTGRVDHVVPAALLLWAVLCYRKPLVAGIFFGLAGGVVYYPLFLLPLWISFYWHKGVWRFTMGVGVMLTLLGMLLSIAGTESLVDHLRAMFGLFLPETKQSLLGGIWGLGWNPIWRLPVIVAFVILCSFFAAWPAQKNLGTLIGCSAAVMVAAQFWHGYGGGLYIAWFLPLLLLTIFRPNLQDRTALKVVSDSSKRLSRSSLEVDAA